MKAEDVAAALDAAIAQKRRELLAPRPTPHVTTGPVYRDSQPFSLAKAILLATGKLDYADSAKHERHVLNEFRRALHETNSLPGGEGVATSYWLPMNWDWLPDAAKQHKAMPYVQEVFAKSVIQSDPDEYAYYVRKGVIQKTQSAYTDTLGGTLVPPPTMGPVIPLIRPQAALLTAGAQTFPLPPQGRHVRPRITGAPVVMALAEGNDAPESDLTTSQMELSAKKIVGMARISEEALAFTSGTIDAYVKAELERSLGLKLDAFGLYGTGGPTVPAGLTSPAYDGARINFETDYPSASGIGSNGNRLLPQYGDLLPALIGERSFNLDTASAAWIMRPAAFASVIGARADSVSTNDRAGPFVDILRRLADDGPTRWRGYRVVQSTNIRGDRTKGTGSNLSDVFFGLWNHCVVASYGAIQFTTGYDAVAFARGQTLVRGIMYGDVGWEYPQAFLWYPNVLGMTGVL